MNASHPNGYRPSRSIGLRNLGHVLGSSIPHTYLRAKALSRAQCHTHTHTLRYLPALAFLQVTLGPTWKNGEKRRCCAESMGQAKVQ